jgi:predicted regulator of Ras-like GTPase activity (Roadblock/LC7/MglB family)
MMSVQDPDVRLTEFAGRVPGVLHAVAVSSGGLVTAASADMPRDSGDQLAAIASGLVSLTQGAARCFEGGPILQTVIEMDKNFLLLMPAADGSSLAVLADRGCDIGGVGYEMALLVEG